MAKVFKLYSMFFSGLRDTTEVLGQVIFKFLSGKLGWLKALIILSIFSLMLGISFYMVRLYILSQGSLGKNTFSDTIFNSIFNVATINGGLNVISVILWGGTIAAATLPVVSNSILTIYNRSSMVSVKNNDLHKITDSIVLQYTSILTIVQLFMLTIFLSVLKYTYSLSPLIYLIGIAVWLVFGLVTVLLAWVTDYILRKHGGTAKALFVGAELGILAALFFLAPNANTDFFGLASLILSSFSSEPSMLILLAGFVFVCIVLIGLIMFFGILTINTTAPFVSNKKLREKRFVSSWLLTLRILFRNGNIRSPIIIMVFVIIGSLVISSNTPTLFGFIFALPMVITMAWMVNIYGITGNGNGWLFSLQGFTRKGIRFFGIINVIIISFTMMIVSAVAMYMGILEFKDTLRFFFSSIIAGIIMTLLAASYSIYKPIKYDVHIRGENILPPSRSLTVLALFMTLGGAPSMYGFAYLNVLVLGGTLLIALIVMPIVLSYLNTKVTEGFRVNDIIAATN
jgi:hypothetical protein